MHIFKVFDLYFVWLFKVDTHWGNFLPFSPCLLTCKLYLLIGHSFSCVPENLQNSEEELALTAIFPNGDCEDRGSGSKACDGVIHMPPEPTGEAR